MGRYLVLWGVDTSRTPEDPESRKAQWGLLVAIMTEDMKSGLVQEFGEFIGETNGYCIVEGEDQQVHDFTNKYVPFITFDVKQAVPLETVDTTVQGIA